MRKHFMKSRIDDEKRSNTIAKSQLEPRPKQNFKYFIGSGNNKQLVKRVLLTRKDWVEATDSKELFINMRWQQSNSNYKYENCIDNRIFKHSLNHFEYHYELSNKEYLFKNIYQYCEIHKMNAFEFIPITFVINIVDSNYQSHQALFLSFYQQNNPKKEIKNIEELHLKRRKGNPHHLLPIDSKFHSHYCKYQIRQPYKIDNSPYLWILKPTFYNRGNGVHVFGTLLELQALMNRYILGYSPISTTKQIKNESSIKKSFRIRNVSTNFTIRSTSFIVQKYMERPLLFSGRKFDIRMWVLITHQLKVFLFKQGYLRTSSYQYNLSADKIDDLNIHLTNNAVQKFNEDYGKYELGNQLSFEYLKDLVKGQGKDYAEMEEKIKMIVKVTCSSVKKKMNKQERSFCYQIFGFDFMLDSECVPWLIEVNTNPCIEQSSPVLQELLPRMLDDAFALTIDQIFEIKKSHSNFEVKGESNSENLWQFIVDLKRC